MRTFRKFHPITHTEAIDSLSRLIGTRVILLTNQLPEYLKDLMYRYGFISSDQIDKVGWDTFADEAIEKGLVMTIDLNTLSYCAFHDYSIVDHYRDIFFHEFVCEKANPTSD